MITEKAIALTTWTFVSKMTSLLFNTLSRFVIAFLSRSTPFLTPWLQSQCNDSGAQENKSVSACTFSPYICPEVMGLDAMILVLLSIEFQASFFTLFFHSHQ